MDCGEHTRSSTAHDRDAPHGGRVYLDGSFYARLQAAQVVGDVYSMRSQRLEGHYIEGAFVG